MRTTVLAILCVLASAGAALAQTVSVEDKPRVAVVKDAAGKVVATIPFDLKNGPQKADPIFAYSPSANTFYVLNAMNKSDDRIITAVNMTTEKVDRVIEVGAGRVVGLLMSPDGTRLFCYTASRPGTKYTLQMGVFDTPRDLKPPFEPAVSVIDTSSNQVIAKYDWFSGVVSSMPKAKFFTTQFVTSTDDGKHLILMNKGESGLGKSLWLQYAVFSGQSPNPTLIANPAGLISASLLSQDQTLFLAAVEPPKQPTGMLDVLDLEKSTASGEKLPIYPTNLIRLGADRGIWVIGSQEMFRISETGVIGDRAILLNKPRKSEEGDTDSASAFLNGYPGETISLGEDHAAILINNQYGASLHRVALLDLKQFQVDSIIATMSSGEIAKIRTGRFLTAMAIDAAIGAAVGAGAGATGTPLLDVPYVPGVMPNMALANEALAARPDGHFLYALDTDIHRVTVIDVQNPASVTRIPVDNSIVRLQVSADGKDLLCVGKKPQKIDLASNSLEN
jgi:DNA-binding beta-propeller fold protein YncE